MGPRSRSASLGKTRDVGAVLLRAWPELRCVETACQQRRRGAARRSEARAVALRNGTQGCGGGGVEMGLPGGARAVDIGRRGALACAPRWEGRRIPRRALREEEGESDWRSWAVSG